MSASEQTKEDSGLSTENILSKLSDLFGAEVAKAFQGNYKSIVKFTNYFAATFAFKTFYYVLFSLKFLSRFVKAIILHL